MLTALCSTRQYKIISRTGTNSVWLAAFLLVGAFYFWIIGIGAEPARFAWNSGLDKYYGLPGPTVVKGTYSVRGYYDLLARAFLNRKLYLPVDPQPELLALPNPWEDPTNEPYRLLDTVLYHGHYYLYHGPVPVLLLFTPWYLLTAHDLPENFAAFLFSLGGYLFLSRLLLDILSFVSLRISGTLLTLCLLALGIGQAVPFLLHRALLYEVAIACGFCCVSAGFYFLFRWLTASRRRLMWSGFSGLAFGLAIGCRPHLGLAAVCAFAFLFLLSDPAAPFLDRFTRKDVLTFALPVIACGLAIVSYNYARFANPLEFGLRYQLGEASYQNIRLSSVNVVPGLYYMLFCPPDLVPEFPFIRLAFRAPFDALVHLPARYFLEPAAGVLSLCPIASIAILIPLCRKRFGGRHGVFAFVLTILVFAIGCLLFLAATGLTSQRYEVDFEPFLLFVACLVAFELLSHLPKLSRICGTAVLYLLLIYAIGANAALALQGPYDQFVQATPHTYVQLAKWFSPLPAYRPLENPPLRVQAEFDLPWPCTMGREPLISAGEFGSRYLLSAQCASDVQVRLFSETSFRSPDWRTVDVDYLPGLNRLGLEFTPQNRTMTVSWNGKVVLRHGLRFLVTAPSQIHFGWDPTLGNNVTFPRRIVVLQQNVTLP